MYPSLENSTTGIAILFIGNLIHIRRSDKKNEEVFYAADVTPDFLMSVFELKSPPKFLKLESTGIKMKILQSNLVLNETYTIEGPGPDMVIRAETHDNGKDFCTQGDLTPILSTFSNPILN